MGSVLTFLLLDSAVVVVTMLQIGCHLKMVGFPCVLGGDIEAKYLKTGKGVQGLIGQLKVTLFHVIDIF